MVELIEVSVSGAHDDKKWEAEKKFWRQQNEVDTEDEEQNLREDSKEDTEEDEECEEATEFAAKQTGSRANEEAFAYNPTEAFIPFIQHTFLAVSTPGLAQKPQRRARSVPEISKVDRYAREVHILMFKY